MQTVVSCYTCYCILNLSPLEHCIDQSATRTAIITYKIVFIFFTVTIKPGNGPLDMQNIMSLVKSVNLPGGAQAQTFVVMSNQKTNNGTIVSSALPVVTQNVVQSKYVVVIVYL